MLKDDIIRVLKEEGDYVSGAVIAEKFGVSRMTINNAVKELVSDGYSISAIKNRGYKIQHSSNAYNLSELEDYIDNVSNIYYYDSVTSTNDCLKELARKGAEEGTIVFADHQTAGKGRLGRSFYSPQKKGIYVSYLYRPNCTIAELSTLTARVAVAVSKAIESVCDVKVDIKWVNDLLLNEKKLCGILTELSVIGEGMKPEFAIVGIGLNVNNDIEDFDGELRFKACSLKSETKKEYSRIKILAEIVKNLRVLFYNDKQADLEYYKNRCYNIGKKAVFEYNDDVVTGLVEGLDENNGLIVRLGKEQITLSSGVVSIKTPKGYC